MATQRVLDFSNFSGIPTPAQFDSLKADGWDGVILGTQFPNTTRQQKTACDLAQFPVIGLYVFFDWDSEDGRRLDEANQLAQEFDLKVWLDCEWGKTGYPGTGTVAPNQTNVINLIASYRTKLGANYTGIYTGRWWWEPYTGNYTGFSTDPLWHAAYESVDFAGFKTYGGWHRPMIWQYSDKGASGVNADLNEMEVIAVADPSVDECIRALVALAHFIRNGWNLDDLSDQDKAAVRFAASKVPA